MTSRSRIIVAVLALIAPVAASGAEWRVWTLKDTRHVRREEPAGSGTAISLAAARNEWTSFQILLRGDAPVEGIRVEPGDLAGPGGSVLPAAAARLFRQHQLELTVGSSRNDAFQPGWYPDPLIPFRHPQSGQPLRGARLAAVPFALPAGQTHGFWVDIFVPPTCRPGRYQGTYRVTAAGGRSAAIPVTLEVWDFELPATPTLQTALGSPAGRMQSYYQQQAQRGKPQPAIVDWAAVEAQCDQLLSEHRINATPHASWAPVVPEGDAFRVRHERVDALRQFIDRYHVNAVAVPHPRSVVKDPDQQQPRLRAWLAAWDQAAAELDRPAVVLYIYLKDEPNTEEEYRYVQKWGRAIRAARSAVKVLVVEQTLTQDPAWGDLNGAVDIWCPLFSLHDQATAAQRQALGESVWTYTALCQGKRPSPWWQIDFPLLNYRVPAWIAWGYRMRGLLYWGSMSHWAQVEDPWTDPKTLDRRQGRKQPLYNGEGTLVYPARAVGYDGVAPSLRLKALRDSIQDYEYLAILQRRGLAAEAEKIVRPLATSWFQWNPDPAAYETARAQLAELIVRGKK
jgi:hypothetical protein